jgi:hypothetical protein
MGTIVPISSPSAPLALTDPKPALIPPPPVLAGAQVLEYAAVDEGVAFTGKLELYAGDRRVGPVARLAIARGLEDGELLLLHCDEAWNVAGVQTWNGPAATPPQSVPEVKERAERYYAGVTSKWIALLHGQRCSFCGEAMPARLFSGRSEAAHICAACVKRFHKQIRR